MAEHDVHVVQLQATQRGAGTFDDMLATQPLVVRTGLCEALVADEELGGHHEILTTPNALLNALLNGTTHVLLRLPIAVDLGVVEEVDSAREGSLHHLVPGIHSVVVASDIREACEVADRLGLIRPIVEQSQYNVFTRNKVEFEYVDLYKKYKLGLTTFSPLAYGTLTGKYSNGKPDGSRFTKPAFASRGMVPTYDERVKVADKLKVIAKELGCSLPQLATAWCVSNEHVSTVLVGASRPEQLEENLKAIEFVDKIIPEVKAKIDAIYSATPNVPAMDPLAFLRKRHL
ncbi:hypothetical protein PR001_g3080 [Phytophthora rubi]|uniref:NADP-dependent oxidoreductase domain-containing protein n=2 Tax=Phytophthora rubi TaxID=129364 RepID=A0A6A3P394_9STRA|nr:hypothetical protein PR001_g3080 [Phytophthora rubi]